LIRAKWRRVTEIEAMVDSKKEERFFKQMAIRYQLRHCTRFVGKLLLLLSFNNLVNY